MSHRTEAVSRNVTDGTFAGAQSRSTTRRPRAGVHDSTTSLAAVVVEVGDHDLGDVGDELLTFGRLAACFRHDRTSGEVARPAIFASPGHSLSLPSTGSEGRAVERKA